MIAVTSPYSAPAGAPGWPADNLFHYKLHLPADYEADGEERYPLMFIAAPQGDAEMGVMAERLERDRWIVEQVGPELRRRGLLFVGLDVIGDYLTEINVTSPTCIRELDRQYDLNISALLLDCIEAKLNK